MLDIHKKKLIIPQSCINELKKHVNLRDNQEKSSRAKKALNELNRIQSLIDIKGDETDSKHADNVFLTVFTKFRITHHLVLITEDKSLCDDLLKLNNAKSVNGKKIEIINIDYIVNANSRKRKKTAKNGHFSIEKMLTDEKDILLTIKDVPTLNNKVYTEQNEEIVLTQSIKAGGEGVVYKTNTDYVAKIYHQKKLSQHKKSKILALTNSQIKIKGVCFPTKILYNSKREFVGYLMPLANGKSLDASVFKGERGMNRHFPDWKRYDLVDLCSTILYKIKLLHEEGILIGDINGANILVCSPKEVYFVDTDSYQINDYPCPVGTATFTAPELQGKDYSTFLRTKGNENFAIATLLFKLLMFGQEPYAHKGGEGIVNNIKSGKFSFPFKDNKAPDIPDGDWKFFWSHLFFLIKQNFYLTFKKGECMYDEDSRPDVNSWLMLVNKYKIQLQDGTLEKIDKESLNLFPRAYKKAPNFTYVSCKICKQEVIKDYTREGYCTNCLKGGVLVKCKSCGEEIEYTNYRKHIKGLSKPNYCKDCIDNYKKEQARKLRTYRKFTCTSCGEEFKITYGERDFFNSKGLDLPKRCKDCRKSGNYPTYDGGYYDDDNDEDYTTTSSSSSSSWCFLTTAACEYFGKPDDCYELTVLREFRDTWLANQADGPRLIESYYQCAPKMVERMKKSEDYSLCCLTLMNKYINPCINLINSHREAKCKELYIEMVNYMNNKYNK